MCVAFSEYLNFTYRCDVDESNEKSRKADKSRYISSVPIRSIISHNSYDSGYETCTVVQNWKLHSENQPSFRTHKYFWDWKSKQKAVSYQIFLMFLKMNYTDHSQVFIEFGVVSPLFVYRCNSCQKFQSPWPYLIKTLLFRWHIFFSSKRPCTVAKLRAKATLLNFSQKG